MWIVDAHRDKGRRFVVRADEMLTAFLELESAIRGGNGKRCMLQRIHLNCEVCGGLHHGIKTAMRNQSSATN
jgi:hypothetical protein